MIRAGEPLGLDQGLFACFGRWLRAGSLPYRDIFDSKPPLHLYTWMLAWLGGSPLSAWIFEGLWLGATCAVAHAVAKKWWNVQAALVAAAAVVVGMWAPALGGYWSRLQAEELLALPLFGAAWCALGGRAVLCGVLVGIAGLYKVPALAAGVAWPALWLVSERASAWRRIARFAVGVTVPWAVACAWFALHGALGDFLWSVFAYQRHWIAMIDPPWGQTLGDFVSISARALAPLWIAAAAGVWFSDRAQRACLLAWIGAAALAIVLQRQLAPYHFLLLVPPLALAAGRGVVELAARAADLYAALGMIVAVVISVGVAFPDWKQYATGGYTRDQFDPAAEREIADYISAHSAPSDGILVWALAPGIYALADRHPVTRFPFHRLLYTDSPLAHAVPGRPERRAELLQRLHDDPPAFVVIGIRDANPFEPQDSMSSLFAWRELSELVTRDYREVMRDAKFVVLARAPASR